MRRWVGIGSGLLVIGACALFLGAPYFTPARTINFAALEGNAERGAYLLRLGGCQACHTKDKGGTAYAGGDLIISPFGQFTAPNITSDTVRGIGSWSRENFAQALLNGKSPDGHIYYPAFPYTSYSKMTGQDVVDLWEAVRLIPAASNETPRHEINSLLASRKLLPAWQILFFDPEEFELSPNQSDLWNRGAYIVNGPGHCVECHTPRSLFGQIDRTKLLGGAVLPPKGEKVPAITADALKKAGWAESDLPLGLKFGFLPDGDVMGGSMGEVLEGSLFHLSNEDIEAIVTYLMWESTP